MKSRTSHAFHASLFLLFLCMMPLVSCTGSGNSTTPGVKKASAAAPIASTNDHPAPPVYAQAAYLLDARTGMTLYSKNADEHLAVYSTIKLMTALVAVEHGQLTQNVVIDDTIQHDLSLWLLPGSSLMGIKGGETYTLQELLDGLLLPSGNDAAIAIADAIAGNVPAFVALMNQKAQQLGMTNTHYTNPHGLPYRTHYSSARDLALLARASLANPIIHQVSASREMQLPATAGHPALDLVNGNQFLWWYPGVDGGKPGFDGDRNFNQVISCVRNGRHLLAVVLGTRDWWTDMRDLLNWGFNTYTWVSLRNAGHPIVYDSLWNYFASDVPQQTIPIANGRYYIYTGYSITPPILPFFDSNGGLGRFGYPLSQARNVNGKIQQRFERMTIVCQKTCLSTSR